jgi:hypothetical protein
MSSPKRCEIDDESHTGKWITKFYCIFIKFTRNFCKILFVYVSEMNFETMITKAPHVLKNILSCLQDRCDAAEVNEAFYSSVCEIEKFKHKLVLNVSFRVDF